MALLIKRSSIIESAPTTSAQLRSVITDETGSGVLVFGTSPTIATPTLSGNITTTITASRALVTNGSSVLAASAVTATELGYVAGVTSGIQAQIDAISAGIFTTRSITTTDTAVTTDDIILASTAGGAYSLTLFTAVGNSGKVLRIRKTTTDLTLLTVDGNAAETISENGTATATTTLATVGETIALVSDGSNWLLVERTIPSIGVSFTPTGNWTTNTTYTGRWFRKGKHILINFHVALAGAPDNLTLTLNLPITIDTSELLSTSGNLLLPSTVSLVDTGTEIYTGHVFYNTTTAVEVATNVVNALYPETATLNATTPHTWANTDFVNVFVTVPVSGWKG